MRVLNGRKIVWKKLVKSGEPNVLKVSLAVLFLTFFPCRKYPGSGNFTGAVL